MEIVLWFFGIIIAFIAILEIIKKLADKKAAKEAKAEAEVDVADANVEDTTSPTQVNTEDKIKFGFWEFIGFGFIVYVVYFLFFSGFNGFNTEQIKKYEEYNGTMISTLRKPTDNIIIRDIANDYVADHSYINSKKMYDCLAYLTWTKSDEYTIGKMIGWCVEDFKSGKNENYVNIAELMTDFSSYDGTYRPLERMIKEKMNDPSSYEHVETKYTHVFDGTDRPYMAVETTFRGNNIYGAKAINTVSAKVDATTKEIYNIEVE